MIKNWRKSSSAIKCVLGKEDVMFRDVQLLIACCIADILRIFAPEAPYKEPAQIKTIFLFIIRQLGGLKDPKVQAPLLLNAIPIVHMFKAPRTLLDILQVLRILIRDPESGACFTLGSGLIFLRILDPSLSWVKTFWYKNHKFFWQLNDLNPMFFCTC